MDWSVYIKCIIIVEFFFLSFIRIRVRIRNNIALEFAYVLFFFKGVYSVCSVE